LRLASELCGSDFSSRLKPLADADTSVEVRGEALVALATCEPREALERASAASLEPGLMPYVIRALERVGDVDVMSLQQYRDEAPPRLAPVIDIILFGDAR
jgi:hypothetical protein